MKKTFTFMTVLFITVSVYAQSPQKMSYQAVIRDSSNGLVKKTAVGMQISILQTSASGSSVYVETHKPTTNDNGLVCIEIGTGTIVTDTFANIDWANGPYFIKTETDPTGGTTYTITGTSQLMSVPYALHAKTAEIVTGTITETDPIYGISIAKGITSADTANWNGYALDTASHLDSAGVSSFGYVTGAHTINTDTQLDSIGLSTLGFVAGSHTVNTDTQLDSAGISGLGYIAGEHTVDTDTHIDSAGISSLGYVVGAHTINTDTQLDSIGVSTLGFVAGSHTVDTDTQLDSAGVSGLGYIAGEHTVDTDTHIDSAGVSSLGYAAGAHTINTDTQLDSAGVSALGYHAGPHADSSAIANMGFVTKSVCGLAVGDTISGGGIIFYLDPSGCHGLVCASTDQSSGIKWHNGTPATTYAFGNGIGAGVGNTSTIQTHQGSCASCYASLKCYNIFINGFQDWYLPSKYELILMYQNIGQGNSLGLGNIGGFNSSTYWSSTEHGPNNVWFTNFSTGVSDGDLKSKLYRVRAVRTF